jgi:hypothetical protein
MREDYRSKAIRYLGEGRMDRTVGIVRGVSWAASRSKRAGWPPTQRFFRSFPAERGVFLAAPAGQQSWREMSPLSTPPFVRVVRIVFALFEFSGALGLVKGRIRNENRNGGRNPRTAGSRSRTLAARHPAKEES